MATELIGIELQLRGEEGVYEDMKRLDTMIRQLGGRHKIELELGKAKQRILELTGEINDTNRAIDKTKGKIKELRGELDGVEKDSDAFEEIQSKLADANEELKEHREHLQKVRRDLSDVRQEANELTNALGRVTSSAYSRFPPTGTPYARRVIFIPIGLINLDI